MKVINQQAIKYRNMKRVYTLISNMGMISRANLSHITRLSKTTVSALVDELIVGGYIVDRGISETNKIGRKPNMLCVNSLENFIGVISWRKYSLEVALVNTTGEIVYGEEIELVDTIDYSLEIKKAVVNKLIPNIKKGKLLGICIVVPAMIDDKNKQLMSTVLPISEENNIILEIKEKLNKYPIAILNDTACLAYAENIYTDIDESDFAYININKGIGAALFKNGKMFSGANGMTTQFGHCSIDRHGEKCSCGNRGCLEGLVGEAGLQMQLKKCGKSELLNNCDELLFEDVANAVEKGDVVACRLMDLLAEDLAYGISNLITMFNPKLVVIGGRGKNLGDRFLKKVYFNINQTSFRKLSKNIKIRYTALEVDSELRGAMKYYMDRHFDFSGNMQSKLILY